MSNQELIDKFIADEEVALAQGEEGKFYLSYWPGITALLSKSLQEIAPEIKRKFYFHILRDDGMFVPHKANYAIYQQACKDTLALRQWPRAEVHRDSIYSLFVFGPQKTLADAEKSIDDMLYEDFAKNYKHLRLFNDIPHLSSLLKRWEKFCQVPDDADLIVRTQKTLAVIGPRRHQPIANKDMHFWGMILCLIADKSESSDAVVLEFIMRNSCRAYIYAFADILRGLANKTDIAKFMAALYQYHPGQWLEEAGSNCAEHCYKLK